MKMARIIYQIYKMSIYKVNVRFKQSDYDLQGFLRLFFITLSRIFRRYSADIDHLSHRLRTNNHLKRQQQHPIVELSLVQPLKLDKK